MDRQRFEEISRARSIDEIRMSLEERDIDDRSKYRIARDEFIDNYLNIATFVISVAACTGLALLLNTREAAQGIKYMFSW